MSDRSFEHRLARELFELADTGVRPFEPHAIAVAVADRSQPDPLAPRRRRRGTRWLLLAAAFVVVAGGSALLAGTPRPSVLPTPVASIQALAFIREDGLYLARSDGSADRLVLPGSFRDLSWSPDGQALDVMETNEVERPGIVTLTASGVQVGRVDGVSPWGPLSWSPDGSLLSQRQPDRRGQVTLQLTTPDGRPIWTIGMPADGDRQWRAPRTIAWRPDGAWVVADLRREANLCHESVVIAADADRDATLFADHEAAQDCSAHRPAWSSDGSRLAMLHSVDGCWPWTPDDEACATTLVTYQVDGDDPNGRQPPVVVSRDVRAYAQPLWMPGDSEILFSRIVGQGPRRGVSILTVPAAGGPEMRLAHLDTAYPWVTWSIPGRSLLYQVGTPQWTDPVGMVGELRALDLAQGTSQSLAKDVLAAAMQPASR